MFPVSPCHSTRPIRLLICCAMTIASGALADGQQSDPLQQQLQELKQKCVETTRLLEQGIAALDTK
jgi:hypothetical protein